MLDSFYSMNPTYRKVGEPVLIPIPPKAPVARMVLSMIYPTGSSSEDITL